MIRNPIGILCGIDSPVALDTTGRVLCLCPACGAEHERDTVPAVDGATMQTINQQRERIDALMAFAAMCQRAHATPGCEREPVKMAYLDLLASRIETTADKREELEERIERLERALRDVQDCDEDVVCSIAEAALRGDS